MGFLLRCRVGDGGGPSVVALQGVIANHSRTAAVKSRGGKRRGKRRAVLSGSGETR